MQNSERSTRSSRKPIPMQMASPGPESDTGQYMCIECSETFDTKLELTSHRQSHVAKKQFTCTHCGRGFHHQVFLQMHERSHEDGASRVKTPPPRVISTRSSKMVDVVHVKPTYTKPPRPLNTIVQFKTEPKVCQTFTPKEFLTRRSHGAGLATSEKEDDPEKNNLFELRISKFSDTTVHLMDSFGNSIEILADVFNTYTIAEPEENAVNTNTDEVPTKTVSPSDETSSKSLTEEPSVSPQTKHADMANDRPPSSEPVTRESVASEKSDTGLTVPELPNAESAATPDQEPMESQPNSETMENVSEKQSVQPSEVSQEKVNQGIDSIIDSSLPANDDDMNTTPEEAASPTSPQMQQNELEIDQTAKCNLTLITDEPIGSTDSQDKRLEEDSAQLPDCSSLGDPGSSKDEPKTIEENKQPEEEMIPDVEQGQDLTLPKSDAEVGQVNPAEDTPPERPEDLSSVVSVNVSEDHPPLEISDHNQSSKEEADLSNILSTNRDAVSSLTEDTSIDRSAEDLGAQNEQSPSSEELSGVGTIIPEKPDLQSASVQENADKNLKTDICMTSEDVSEVSISEGEVGLPERDVQADNKEPEKHGLLSGQDMLHDDDGDDDDDDDELVIDDKRDEDLFERDIFPLEVCEKSLASVEEQNIVCGGEAHRTKIVQEKESDICLNGSDMTYISESEMIKLLEQDKDDIAEDEPIAASQKDLETMKNDDQAFSQSKLEPELSTSEENKSSRIPVAGNGEQNTVDDMLTGQGSELPASMEEDASEVQLDQNKLKTIDHVRLPSEDHNLSTFQAPSKEKTETGSCSPLSFLTNDEPRTGESPDSIESMLTQDSVSKNSSEEQLAPSSGNLQPITAEDITDLPQPEQDLPCRDQNYKPSGTSTGNQDVNPVGDAAMSRSERTHEPITPEEETMDVCVSVEDNECDDEQTDSLEGPSLKDAVIQSGQEKPRTGIAGYEGLVCSIEQSKTKDVIDSLPSKQKDVIDSKPLAKHDAKTDEMICNQERKSKPKNVDQELKNPPLDVLDDMQSTSNDNGDRAKATSPERRDLKDEGMQDKRVDQDAVFLLKENENDDAETDICTQEQTTDLSSNLDSSSKTVSTNENVESKKSSLDKKLSSKEAEDHELGELPTGVLEDNSLPKDMEEDLEKRSIASPKDIESEVMDDEGSATKQVSDVASSIGQAVCKDSLQDALEDSELMENDHQEDADNTDTPSKPPGAGGECLKCGRKIRRGRKEMVRLPVCFKCRKAAKRQERLSNQETADGADLALDPLKSRKTESLSAELSDSPIKQDGDSLIHDPLVGEKEASGPAAKKRYKCPKCDETFRIPALLAGHIKCHSLPQCLTCGCPMQLKYKTKRIPRRCQKCVQQLKEKRAKKKVAEGSGDEYSATSDDEDADINPDNVSDEDSQVIFQKARSPLDEEVDSFKKDKEKSKKQEIESDDELDTSDQNLDLPDSEKPRLCPQCDKAFPCNRSLNLHLLSHTAVQCESCGCRLSKRRKVGRWSKKCRSCRLQIKGKLLTDSGDELSLSGDKLPKQKNVASLRLKAKQAKMSKNTKIQAIIKKKKELKWMNMLLAVKGLMDKSRRKKESALKAAELAKKDGESSEAEKCDESSVESTSIHPDDPKSDLHDPDMEKAGSSELPCPPNKTPKKGRKCLYREKNIIKVEESEVLPYVPGSTFIKQEETWQCLECNQTWPNSEALVNHQHSHTTGQSFTCPQCPQVFSTEEYLDLHVHSHDEDRPFSCPECDKTFTKRNNLGVHMRVHAGSRPFACPDCPRRFRQKVTLLAHRYSHRNYELLFAKPFQCSVCSKSFKMKERLVVHERLHTGECPFSCKDCDEAFPSKARLYVHRKMHKISEDPSSSEQNLSKEISEGQPFKCQDCGKVCSTKASFVLHRKIHRLSSMPVKIIKREKSEEEHPFGCKECNKVFSSKGNLKIHLKNHSAHKAMAKSEMSPDPKGCFPCKDCDKVCSTKASFVLHRKVHKSPSDGEPNPIIKVESDTPSYVCNFCSKVCSTKASLVLHRKVHKTPGSADSETPSFRCKDCDLVFSTKVSYLLHRKVHRSASKSKQSPKAYAELQSYDCKHCDMVCSTKASFVLHSKVHKTPTTSEQNLKVDAEPQSYNCKHCDMVCSTKASFILHSKVHRSLVGEQSPKGVEEPQLYNCKYCVMVCSTKASFILHSKVHRSLLEGEQSPKTSGEPQLYNCKHCDMVCSTKASFVLHSKVHRSLVGEQSLKDEGLKSFRCKQCDMVCSTKASFVLHSKVHKSGQNLQANIGQKHFTCKICKKVCSTKASFILHRKVHKSSSSENNPTPKADGEESSFPCKDCDKVYSSKGRLASHVNKVHEDSSNHEQNADNESNAEQPKKTTEEKTFSCTTCGLRFAKLKMLVRHKVVHGERTVTPCIHCGKRFLYMKSLFNHVKICQSKGKGKKLLLLKKAAAKRKIPKDAASTSSDGESSQKKRKVNEKQKALKAAQKLKTKNLTVKAKKAAASKEKGKGKGTKDKRAKVDGEGASEGEGKKTTTEKQSDGKEEKPSEQTAKEPTPKKKNVTKVKKTKKEPAKEKPQKVGGPKKWRMLAASTIKKKNLQAIIIGGKKKVLIKKKVQMKPKSGAKAGKD